MPIKADGRISFRLNDNALVELVKLAGDRGLTVPVAARRVLEEAAAQGRLQRLLRAQAQRHAQEINRQKKAVDDGANQGRPDETIPAGEENNGAGPATEAAHNPSEEPRDCGVLENESGGKEEVHARREPQEEPERSAAGWPGPDGHGH